VFFCPYINQEDGTEVPAFLKRGLYCESQVAQMEMKDVGIEDVAVYFPDTKLSLTETYADAKDEASEKFSKGLGVLSSTLPDTYEDAATMGAEAVLELFEKNDIDPDQVRRLDVATESSWDASKPLSTYIGGMLEDVLGDGALSQAEKLEHKFACLGGTHALNDTVNELLVEGEEDEYGIVVATDTAWYEKGSSGEPTQGAGAIALLVGEDPSLTELSLDRGMMATDENDFLKPKQQYPNVAGERSQLVYLNHMRGALNEFRESFGDIDPDELDYVAFHVPFPKMAKKASPLGLRNLARGTGKAVELAEEVGRPPRAGALPDADVAPSKEAYLAAEREYEKKLASSDVFEEFYERAVEPTLSISEKTGNWYTGSVHLARLAALFDAAENGIDSGMMLVGSYGSGAGAEIHAERLKEGFDEALDLSLDDLHDRLADCYELEWDEYQRLHDFHNYEEDTEIEPFSKPEGFVRNGTGEMGERLYEYVGPDT